MLPETYKFPRGTTPRAGDRSACSRRRSACLRKSGSGAVRIIPIKTPEQLVTLASIVEKETGKADERSRVAAVFVNRLRQRIKLQSDPTIIYGLVGGKGTLGRPIKRSEIQQPSPYNTYVVDGLPPGPIANPGRASLEAAANPARTRDLFFVADGTGGHCLHRNLRPAPEERRQAAGDGKANSERYGRAGRRSAACGRRRRRTPLPTATTTKPALAKKPARAVLRPGRARRNRTRPRRCFSGSRSIASALPPTSPSWRPTSAVLVGNRYPLHRKTR